MMRAALAILMFAASGTVSAAAHAQAPHEPAVLVGRVDAVRTLDGGFSEFDVIVLKVLSGKDPGEFAHVKVKTSQRDLEGLMITLVIDPELKLEAPGQSWWSPTNYPAPLCVPKEIVRGSAHAAFVTKSFEQDGKKCVSL